MRSAMFIIDSDLCSLNHACYIGHVFHLACLKQSLQHVSGVCPLCRKRDKHTIRLYFDGDADSRRLSTASGSQSLANASSRMVTELNTKVDSLSRRLDEAHSFRLREEKLATELKLQLHASLAVGQSCRETIERQKRTVDGLEKEKDALQVISNELRSLVRRTRGEKKELEDELSNLRENYCTLNATRRLEKRKVSDLGLWKRSSSLFTVFAEPGRSC